MNARSFVRNFASLLCGRAGGDFFIFLLIVVVARRFGPEGNGTYGVAMGIAGFFVAFADLGLRQYTIKQISAEGIAEGFLGRVLGLRLLLTLGCSAVLLGLCFFLRFEADAKLVLLAIGLQQVLRSLAEGVSAVFVAKEKSLVPGALEAVCKGLGAGGAITLIFSGRPLGVSLMALPVSEAINAVAAMWWVQRHAGSLRPRFDFTGLRQTLRATTPYAAVGVLQQFASRIDVLFVGFILGAGAAGIYHAAFRLVVVALFVPYFASYALLPIFTRVFHSDPRYARLIYHRILGGTVLLGLPAVVGLAWIAPRIILDLFGPEFADSIPLLRLLAGLILLVWLSENLGIILLATDRVTTCTRHKAWAAAVNVVGNTALLPVVGVAGAAYASFASELVLIVLHAWALGSLFGPPRVAGRLAIAGLGCAAFCGVLALLPTDNLAVAIPTAGLVYGVVILAFPTVRRTEGRVLLAGAGKAKPI